MLQGRNCREAAERQLVQICNLKLRYRALASSQKLWWIIDEVKLCLSICTANRTRTSYHPHSISLSSLLEVRIRRLPHGAGADTMTSTTGYASRLPGRVPRSKRRALRIFEANSMCRASGNAANINVRFCIHRNLENQKLFYGGSYLITE